MKNAKDKHLMLETVDKLFANLNKQNIRYCHWKSNYHLEYALSGKEDLDLLIDRRDSELFETVLLSLGFKRALPITGMEHLSVAHYYGLDDKSGSLIHVHSYYKVVTGDSLLKNFCFPINDMLLDNCRYLGNVKVPSKGAEVVVFVLRTM